MVLQEQVCFCMCINMYMCGCEISHKQLYLPEAAILYRKPTEYELMIVYMYMYMEKGLKRH